MQRFELLGRNGAGANSTVFRCRDNGSGGIVAVKKLEGATFEQIMQEAAIMRVCAHPHCVELLEVHQGIASNTFYLVIEHVEHSLSRELLLNPRGLPLCKAKQIAFQLALALELVHHKKVVHGDLKPANVLLTAHSTVKLCDFGSATSSVLQGDPAEGAGPADGFGAAGSLSPVPSACPEAPKVTAAASRWYCAPESLLGWSASPASDIWALGCILGELITGKPLMPGGENEVDQLCRVVSMVGRLSDAQEQVLGLLPYEQRKKLEAARAEMPLLDRIPKVAACPALVEVLRACLQPNPACRPTAQQLQGMPFFDDVRQALLAGKAAGGSADTRAAATSMASGMQRTASAEMELNSTASGAANGLVSGAQAAMNSAASPALPADASAAAVHAVQPPRRVSGVQAAAPLRPVSRARVSALTATIRGNPFEGEGGYTDLMPSVLRLAAKWEEAREREELGPIAWAARRSSSISPATSLPNPHTEELPVLGERMQCGAVGALAAAPVEPLVAQAVTGLHCITPIAAAAGGCGGASRSLSTELPPSGPAAAVSGATSSPMDCSPPAPAAATAPATTQPAPTVAAASAKHSVPLSASVGAVPYMAKAAEVASAAEAAAAAGNVPGKSSPARLRSRAILNRARRHHSREPSAGSMPSGFFSMSNSNGGLGSSATLMQRELAAAAAPVRQLEMLRPGCHAVRRSYADLSDLASVAEYEALAFDTTQDVKRRRGLLSQNGLHHAHSSQPSVGSFNTLATEASLESLQENEPVLLRSRGSLTAGGRRMRRSSSSGTGLIPGSPVRHGAWPQLILGGVGMVPPVSLPQPISGRNRCRAMPARELAASVNSDAPGSAASDMLRREVA